MVQLSDCKYLVLSLFAHGLVLFCLVMGFSFSKPLPVIKNSNQQDVISAVVLGETPKSKILPEEVQPPPPPEPIAPPIPSPPTKVIPLVEKQSKDEDAIALKLAMKKLAEEKRLQQLQKKLAEQKKIAEQKALAKKQQQLFAKDLLADITKHHERHKKIQQKKLQKQFATTLKSQAESSLREELLDEEIRLKSQQARKAQGEINKYQALILQAISEHWIVPTQANRKLYCELMIRLAPGGLVLDVQVTKTSGDLALDRSARAAVLKASPLPVPKDVDAFEAFKRFKLKVKPENILGNTGGIG